MERSDIAKAEDFLRVQLASGPKLFRDLISASGIHPRSLQRASQRLGIKRSRDGQSGPWRWGLDELEYLFASPVDKPEPLAEPPIPIPEVVPISLPLALSPPLPSDIESLLALAVAKGFDFPLYVTSRPSADDGLSACVFSAMGAEPECRYGAPVRIVSPYWTAVCAYREMTPGRYGPINPTLVVERGRGPEWREWGYRRPR
jgi:hypothetical protein